MMQPTSRVKDMERTIFFALKLPSFGQAHDRTHRNKSATRDSGRDLMHPWQRRRITIAKAVLEGKPGSLFQLFLAHRSVFRLAELLHCCDIIRGMHQA